ncbi:hypothetical protein [Rhizobium sp. BK176]|uniref:hypothetical protein n=1 Tax=Rhizobium sp. BK176 TaxID=2587071 RepID=UPI00216A6152|nr:hypothetical protein [Rhizobium sp. BK176]MCS4088704.1 hypothetical protein [Rhizobium sp. BK176]
MTADKTDCQVLEEALARYFETHQDEYNPRERDYHFLGFRIFAEDVIGDAFRKIRTHAFPKVEAASTDGVSIGPVSLVPRRRADDGRLYEFTIQEGGVDRFVVRTLHTPAGRMRKRSSDTVVLLRPRAQYGITHASFSLPNEEFSNLRYGCHDGPGALPGLTEACKLILPFIKDEVANDAVTQKFSLFRDEYMALVERDGGLPGALTARFGDMVLERGMGAIYDWIARELPALDAKVGRLMTWPDNSLRFNDQDENAVMVRAPGAIALVHFIPPSSDPHHASMQVLRQDDKGQPISAESYLVPVGNGDMVRTIEAFRNGEAIEGHPMMSFDFQTRRITTTPAFLETKRYQDVALSTFHVGYDWRGRRSEEYAQGIHRFMDWDGIEQAVCHPQSAPSL